MYSLINQHIDQLLDVIDSERDIQPYSWLVQNLNDTNVATDPEYQQVYRQYWRLNAARLSEGFRQSYFDLLEELKQEQITADVETVSRRLLEVPTHNDGRHALQFSFGT